MTDLATTGAQAVVPECIVCGGPHYYYGHLADALNREMFGSGRA